MFEFWPFTNFHQLNLDWIIKEMKQHDVDIQDLNERIDEIIVEASDFVLPSTGDDTDRSADIMNRLNTSKYCFLGPGKFMINNTINMPEGSALLGMGNGTVLQLADNSTDNIAVNVGTLCTVTNMTILGYSSDLPYQSFTQGSRKGVALLGDYVDFEHGTYSHNFAKLDNLTIKNFDHSGIWAFKNDGAASFLASNIDIQRCHTGINIEHFSEFHSFSNTRCRWCNIALVMQGGNNLFSNCHFDVNLVGIKIDNSDDSVVNGDHSSFSNCSICHSDNNNGYAIYFDHSVYGICFSNCQIWYGKIYLNRCTGIKFNNNVMAGAEITVSGSNNVSFIGNLLRDQTPTINISDSINIIWENNTDVSSNLIIRSEDRGSNRNLNASIIRVADFSQLQFEGLGLCMSANTWSLIIPLPGVFSMDSFHFDLSRVVLLGRGEVPAASLPNIGVTVNPTFVRLDGIPYTGTTGEVCYIDVRAALRMYT